MRQFHITQYVWAHGKAPRGFGGWSFVPGMPCCNEHWPLHLRVDLFGMTYGAAKKEIARTHPKVTSWQLLP